MSPSRTTGPRPTSDGINILYADGHVQWQPGKSVVRSSPPRRSRRSSRQRRSRDNAVRTHASFQPHRINKLHCGCFDEPPANAPPRGWRTPFEVESGWADYRTWRSQILSVSLETTAGYPTYRIGVGGSPKRRSVSIRRLQVFAARRGSRSEAGFNVRGNFQSKSHREPFVSASHLIITPSGRIRSNDS